MLLLATLPARAAAVVEPAIDVLGPAAALRAAVVGVAPTGRFTVVAPAAPIDGRPAPAEDDEEDEGAGVVRLAAVAAELTGGRVAAVVPAAVVRGTVVEALVTPLEGAAPREAAGPVRAAAVPVVVGRAAVAVRVAVEVTPGRPGVAAVLARPAVAAGRVVPGAREGVAGVDVPLTETAG